MPWHRVRLEPRADRVLVPDPPWNAVWALVAQAQRRGGGEALDAGARMILLHPRGWAAETAGRSEPG